MTSGTAVGPRGFRHELFLHHSTDDLLEFVVPLARDGVAAQQPTLLLLRPDTAQAVLHQVGPSPHLTIQQPPARPAGPALHLSAAGPTLSSYARVVHQEPAIPRPRWPKWRRFEAVLNLALRHHDTWVVCAYDRRTLTADMAADLQATHPLIGQHGRHQRNARYQHPVNFLGQHSNDLPDPIEQTPPAVELVDPSPATARATVNWFAHQRLPTQEIDKLVFATHEAFTNALIHGRPPTVLRLWAQPDRVTVTVTDTGPGPTDPLVGLLPPDPRTDPGPGLGLWLINQLVDVTHRHLPGGYTVRLTTTHPDDHTS
jgi:anti-sigma regulatory factor (Ser/Thr protein kinase)